MTNTTAASLAEYRAEVLEDLFGSDWIESAERGERFLSERDFPVSEDTDGVSDADWDAFLEDSWVDPAERF